MNPASLYHKDAPPDQLLPSSDTAFTLALLGAGCNVKDRQNAVNRVNPAVNSTNCADSPDQSRWGVPVTAEGCANAQTPGAVGTDRRPEKCVIAPAAGRLADHAAGPGPAPVPQGGAPDTTAPDPGQAAADIDALIAYGRANPGTSPCLASALGLRLDTPRAVVMAAYRARHDDDAAECDDIDPWNTMDASERAMDRAQQINDRNRKESV